MLLPFFKKTFHSTYSALAIRSTGDPTISKQMEMKLHMKCDGPRIKTFLQQNLTLQYEFRPIQEGSVPSVKLQ
jgi:hypothetical protein